MLDHADRIIIARLQADGRTPMAELGQAAGLSTSAAHDRVRRLTERGVIEGMTIRVDPVAIGRGVVGFVFVALDRPAAEPGFIAATAADGAVLDCHHVTGDWSYLLKVRVADIGGLEALLGRLKRIDGLVRSHSLIALSSPKDGAAPPPFPDPAFPDPAFPHPAAGPIASSRS
ncbi:AsnC family transcriptional regulator [Tistrella bauzanensis]|uniref:AsnC family transcriptional regulator n=1 Tax=Tistrella bauzanensis TaxID=657419 RepID=A0ABQ1IJE1_9PROT|nr:Lrp/AsnC family transcriptional regulator [Tistrella bauzanensis]GGB43712.1 AsnC family transcriptional regulator [Tistrella bauzanensis]